MHVNNLGDNGEVEMIDCVNEWDKANWSKEI